TASARISATSPSEMLTPGSATVATRSSPVYSLRRCRIGEIFPDLKATNGHPCPPLVGTSSGFDRALSCTRQKYRRAAFDDLKNSAEWSGKSLLPENNG